MEKAELERRHDAPAQWRLSLWPPDDTTEVLHRVPPRVRRLAASHRIGHRQDRRPRRERSQPGVRPAGLQGHRGGKRARRNLGHQAARHRQRRREQCENTVGTPHRRYCVITIENVFHFGKCMACTCTMFNRTD